LGGRDVFALGAFVATYEQDDHFKAANCQICPVTRAGMDTEFANLATY
jgi:hypothetical protein